MNSQSASTIRWRRSARCAHTSGCVDIAPFGGGLVAVRDDGPEDEILIFAGAEWRRFARDVKKGRYDLP